MRPRIFLQLYNFITKILTIFEVSLLRIVRSPSTGFCPARFLPLSPDLSVASSRPRWVLCPV